jgi:beta,beta-carotene 9',10'-dioxygenase
MKFSKIVLFLLFLFLGGIMAFTFLQKKITTANVSADLEEEVANISLETKGDIPPWLTGSLVRNGPINVTVNGETNKHLFDGLAMLHLFSFEEGKVTYSNKFLRTDAYRTVFEEGSLQYGGFAVDPCRSLFKRFFTMFTHENKKMPNANVNVAKLANSYVAMTETPLPIKFDPRTLATLGVLDYHDALPKDKCWESAHLHYDQQRKETINYLINFGRHSHYIIYKIEDGSDERKVIAQVPVEQPAYMHSFAVTENHIILTEFPFVVNPLDLLIKGKPFITNFAWNPERGTNFLVVDRKDGKVIGNYKTRPFFAFHHANAFEEGDKINLDIASYEDAKIISGDALNVDSVENSIETISTPLERFSLNLKTGEISSEVLLSHSNEFPRINEKMEGRAYRYVYAVGTSAPKSLLKIDTKNKRSIVWMQENCSPGEPVFVSSPDAKEEEDGVVLAVILDHQNKDSFLLVLDGKTFQEIGRANAPHSIPLGFHGQYFQ